MERLTFNFLEMLDTAPYGEEGSKELLDQKKEARRYRELLYKAFGRPEGTELKLKENPHDFGTYASLEAWGDNDNDEHWEWVNSFSECDTWKELEAKAASKTANLGDGSWKIPVTRKAVQHCDLVIVADSYEDAVKKALELAPAEGWTGDTVSSEYSVG